MLGVAAAVVAILVISVAVMATRQPAATGSSAVVPPPASSTPTAVPTATPISAAALKAGQEYLAGAAPLNAAENAFGHEFTLDQSRPCSCPRGQFNAGPALRQIPGIDVDIENFQGTLQQIKREVPTLYLDINPVIADNQTLLHDFVQAYQAYQRNDPASTNFIAAVVADQAAAAPDVAKLRADLGLPPPPA